jgi:hypothetical protein
MQRRDAAQDESAGRGMESKNAGDAKVFIELGPKFYLPLSFEFQCMPNLKSFLRQWQLGLPSSDRPKLIEPRQISSF